MLCNVRMGKIMATALTRKTEFCENPKIEHPARRIRRTECWGPTNWMAGIYGKSTALLIWIGLILMPVVSETFNFEAAEINIAGNIASDQNIGENLVDSLHKCTNSCLLKVSAIYMSFVLSQNNARMCWGSFQGNWRLHEARIFCTYFNSHLQLINFFYCD